MDIVNHIMKPERYLDLCGTFAKALGAFKLIQTLDQVLRGLIVTLRLAASRDQSLEQRVVSTARADSLARACPGAVQDRIVVWLSGRGVHHGYERLALSFFSACSDCS